MNNKLDEGFIDTSDGKVLRLRLSKILIAANKAVEEVN